MRTKSNLKLIIYETSMIILALAVAVILYIDFTQPLTTLQKILLHRIDYGILLIFAVDYFVRLAKAENKAAFFKKNIFDLISIIPFDMTFRAARLIRLTRIGRLFRLLRVGIILSRRLATPLGILRTNGLGKVLIITSCIVMAGSISIYYLEPETNSFGDSLWWAVVTTTTVGYGDISPSSVAGRIIAVLLMVVGIGTLGMLTASIATFFLGDKNHKDEVKTVIQSKVDRLEELSEVEYQELLKLIELRRNNSNPLNFENQKGYRK